MPRDCIILQFSRLFNERVFVENDFTEASIGNCVFY